MSIANFGKKRNSEEFFSDPEALVKYAKNLVCVARAPRFGRGIISRLLMRRMKKVQFWQVAPWGDAMAQSLLGRLQKKERCSLRVESGSCCSQFNVEWSYCSQPLSGL
jgi:hypothetical protein